MFLFATAGATGSAAVNAPSALPSDALSAISATLAELDGRYRVESSPDGLHASNPAQGAEAIFTARGVTLRTGRERLTIRFAGYGRAQLAHPASVAPAARANRAEYSRGELTEWYSNGPYGLEQGFTLASRPKGPPGPLRIALSVSGMTGSAAWKTGPVTFSGRDGTPLIRCAELTARDSLGHLLPARMALRGQRLLIVVDDSEARYPVVVDPTYSQTAILTAGRDGSRVGTAVAVDNQKQTIVAAAFGNLSSISGSAYVFVKQASGQWALATQLENRDLGIASVAISGDGNTVVVGSCGTANCIGHAFVYSVPSAAGGWASAVTMQPTAMLSAPNAQLGDRIGQSVATDYSGDTIAFGVPCDTTAGMVLCGSAYVFVQPPSGIWVSSDQPTAQLTFNLPSGLVVDSLGFSVAMDAFGDTIVVGAPGVQAAGANQGSGSAYVFVRPTSALGSWVTTSTATTVLQEGLAGFNGDAFGSSVAIDFQGDTIAVGAPYNPSDCSPQPCFRPGPGAAYVFAKPTSARGWADGPNPKNPDAMLTAAAAAALNRLGVAVSIAANGATVLASANDGAYVFNMPSGGWANLAVHEDQRLAPATGVDIAGNAVTPTAGFSSVFVSTDGSLVIGGNPGATVGSNATQGAVLLFAPATCATLTPASYTFPVSPQYIPITFNFTLANNCNSPLNNISASVVGPNSGDFAVGQSNGIPCGETLAANSSCNLTVTFVPTFYSSNENATLTVADVDAHSPQQAALSGVGGPSTADFALAPTSAAPASSGSNCTLPSATTGSCSATVTAGDPAVFTFQITALNGFSSVVDVRASSERPDGASPILVSRGALYPSANGSDVTVTVPTTATGAVAAAATSAGHGSTLSRLAAFAFIPGSLSIAAVGWRSRSRNKGRRYWSGILAMLAVLMAATGLTSCDENGGASSGDVTGPAPPPASIAPGTYEVQIDASSRGEVPPSGAGSHFARVTVVVVPAR